MLPHGTRLGSALSPRATSATSWMPAPRTVSAIRDPAEQVGPVLALGGSAGPVVDGHRADAGTDLGRGCDRAGSRSDAHSSR